MWFISLNRAIQPDWLEIALCEIFQPAPLGANREFQVQLLMYFGPQPLDSATNLQSSGFIPHTIRQKLLLLVDVDQALTFGPPSLKNLSTEAQPLSATLCLRRPPSTQNPKLHRTKPDLSTTTRLQNSSIELLTSFTKSISS